MKETLHIIARTLSKKEIEDIGSSPAAQVFYHFTVNSTGLPNTIRDSSLTPEQKKLINYRVMDLVLSLGNRKINGRSVSDLLEYESMNFWFYQRLTIYMTARNLEYLLEEARIASKEYSVVIYCNIPEDVISNHLPSEVAIKYAPKKVQGRKVSGIRIAMFATLFREGFRSPAKISGKHLVLDNARPVNIYNESGKGNFVLHNLFKSLDDRFCLIREAGLPGKRTAKISDFRNSVQYRTFHVKNISSDLVLLHALLNPSARKQIRAIRSELGRSILLLKNKFTGTEFSVLVHLLSGLNSSFRIYIMRYIGFREICLKYRPESLSASDENSPYNKSLLDAAKSLGIKTIGIQHGAIHELHPAYRLTKEEAEKNITPDLTLVWGEYWKNLLLEKGNYKETGIRITGQIRTDIIPDMPENKENRSGEVVLFASQPQRDPTLREKAAADLFEAAAATEGISILLKPHPLEKDYLEYYSSIAADKGLDNIAYMPDGDLYELINTSDAVYTCFSTVGTEAVYFSKSLIIHDPLDQDVQGYISAGVAHRVRNTGDCKTALISLRNKTLEQNPESVSSFIGIYASKIDGKVSERVISEITGDS